MKTKKQYYRLLTYVSKDLNPVIKRDLLYFDSGDYETDKTLAREYKRGYRCIYLSKRKYDTFGELITLKK